MPQQNLYEQPNKRPPLSTITFFISIIALLAGVAIGGTGDHLFFLAPSPTAIVRPVLASTTIEIASDFPTDGLDATDGLPLQNGVQMAIAEANHEHVLPKGYTLQLLAKSDTGLYNRHDPQQGADNISGFIADKLVAGVIGPYNSSVALKELPLSNKALLAQLSPSTTFPCLTKSFTDDPACTGTNDVAAQMQPSGQLTFFRLATTDDRQGRATADYLFRYKHYSKVLLLKDSDDPYSSGLAQAFQTEWQHIGGLVISVDLPQDATSEQDYQQSLEVAATLSSPDLIYFAGGSPNGSYVLQALSTIPTLKAIPFAGSDGIMKSDLLGRSQRDAPIYASLPIADPAHAGTAIGKDFEIDYEHSNYEIYRPYVAAAYDCTRILIQAIKTALTFKHTSTPHGAQDNTGAVQFRRAILQVLQQQHFSYTGATGTHAFDAHGDTMNYTISFYQADLSTPRVRWTWLQQVNA